jgi:hypothetical protein
VGLERGPLSLVSITEELLGRNSSGSGQENREYDRGDPLRRPRNTLYPQKLVILRQETAALGRHSSLADQSHGVFFFFIPKDGGDNPPKCRYCLHQIILHHIPENNNIYSYHHENCKSHINVVSSCPNSRLKSEL